MHQITSIIPFLFCFSCALDIANSEGWNIRANIMVKNQIEGRGIQDAGVLRAMRETPRHLFIPENLRDMAYDDGPLPIGEGQTISQPYIVALMTELLQLTGNEKILEIGTGSGYQAAVLSPLAKEIYSIEIIQSLADRSNERLKKMRYNNVTVKCGDGYKGWKEHAPFDRIIVTAAPNDIPPLLINQLKVGGKLVLPVGTRYQKLKVITKMQNGEIGEKNIISVRFVPMVHSNQNFSDSSNYKIIK